MPDITIKSVKQRFGKATGPHKKSDGSRVWNDEYVVIAGVDAEGDHILAATLKGIPKDFSPHLRDSGALVVDRTPDDQGGGVWYVSVTWDSNHADPNQANDDPTDDPIKWRWDVEYRNETPEHDRLGKAYTDIVGTPFSPPPEFRVPYQKLTITHKLTSFDHLAMNKFTDTCNEKAFWDHPAKTAMMDAPTATEEFAGGDSYWKVRYVILFKPNRKVRDATGTLVQDTWDRDFRKNEGPKMLKLQPTAADPTLFTSVLVAAEDENGVTTGDVTLLDQFGFRLPKGVPVEYVEFAGLEVKDWSTLLINNPATPTT